MSHIKVPPGCRLVSWLQQPTGLAGLNGWLGWLKPDPDRSAFNYGLLTRSTRPRWYQPTPDPKPLWWRETRREPPAVCNAGRGLEKENIIIIIKIMAVPPGPCRAGHGRLRFLPNSFWVACHVLGCVWVCVDAGFVRLILIGFCFCTACGECGVFCWCPLLT